MSNSPRMLSNSVVRNSSKIVSSIVELAHTLCYGLFSTNTRGIVVPLSFMEMSVLSYTTNQLKIFNSIVQFISIYVMDNLRALKGPTETFFHDESVFIYITRFIREMMSFPANNPITIHNRLTPFPPNTVFSTHNLFLKQMPTFVRARFSSALAKFPSHNLKRLGTRLTNYGGIFHIPIYYPIYRTLSI